MTRTMPGLHASTKRIAQLQLATGVGLLLFWAAFFTVGLAPANPPPGYLQFEHSFTVPDIVLALALIVASRWWQGADPRPGHARALSLVCAGMLIFLGMLDVSFNLQNGMYTIGLLDAVLALAINVWCIGFGAYVAYVLGVAQDTPPRS